MLCDWCRHEISSHSHRSTLLNIVMISFDVHIEILLKSMVWFLRISKIRVVLQIEISDINFGVSYVCSWVPFAVSSIFCKKKQMSPTSNLDMMTYTCGHALIIWNIVEFIMLNRSAPCIQIRSSTIQPCLTHRHMYNCLMHAQHLKR